MHIVTSELLKFDRLGVLHVALAEVPQCDLQAERGICSSSRMPANTQGHT